MTTKKEFQQQLKEKLNAPNGYLTRDDISYILRNFTKTPKGLKKFLTELEVLKKDEIQKIIDDIQSYEQG